MTSKDARQLAALIRAQFDLHELLPHLVRLLCDAGKPVTVEHAAETGGWTVEQVRTEWWQKVPQPPAPGRRSEHAPDDGFGCQPGPDLHQVLPLAR